MGLIGLVAKIAGVVVLALVALVAFAYFTDYEAEATITDKGRDAEGDFIVLRPKLIPREFAYHLDAESARYVCEGYQVAYRVQTGHYVVRDASGEPFYDSDSGLTKPTSLLTPCSGSGLPV